MMVVQMKQRNMNYKMHYDSLIRRALNRKLSVVDTYVEIHHIIPRAAKDIGISVSLLHYRINSLSAKWGDYLYAA